MRHAADAGLKLHLGCGPYVVPGWENLDKSPSVLLAYSAVVRRVLRRLNVISQDQAEGFPRGIRYVDVTRKLPYPDGSVMCIYSSHMIEHLSRWHALNHVRDCARVLARGALMRIATPDLRSMATAYVTGTQDDTFGCDTPADAFMTAVNPFYDTPGRGVRRFVRRHLSASMHQWLYDAESLAHLLDEGGLPGAHVCHFRVGELPDLDVIETRPNSLFIEVRAS